MRKLLFILLCLPMIGFGQDNDRLVEKNQAILSANNWLTQIDNREYELSWTNADIAIQNVVAMKDWENLISGTREPLGKIIERTVVSSEYHTELPGAPDGEYVIIVFESSFRNKKSAIETVTPRKGEDGNWRVAGYYIR